MSELLLSFIMPTFNSSEYLAKTMDSLIASIGQHSSSVEIICVDDGSTDSTVAILEEYKSVFDNLIIIRNNHGGVSQARNTALDMVSGTFISFVDSDDLFEENFLDIFSSIENNFDILFTDVKSLASNLYIPRISFEKKIDVFKNSLRIGEYGIEPGVAGKFFRTEIVNKNRIRFNTELSVSEDVLFNFNFITYADNVLLSSEKFYTVTGTHSLMFYNEKNLAGQVEFVNQVRKILSIYPDNSDKQLLEDKFILNAMTIFIDRYFGPLWLNGTYSLNKASKLMKTTIEDNKFSKAFNSSRLDYSIGCRYVVFRKLLRLKQYKLCLIYNRIMDKIKGYERFRKD